MDFLDKRNSLLILYVQQTMALIHRYFLNALRNKFRTFLPIILSLLCFIGMGISAKWESKIVNQKRGILNKNSILEARYVFEF